MAVRDVSAISLPLVGRVVERQGDGLPYRLSFPGDGRAENAANGYLRDLADSFARPSTLRSYGYDLLRWLRFLAAVGVSFDRVGRTDFNDFVRWMVTVGKTGGARRPRAEPQASRLNRLTGKLEPHDRDFDPATIRHSRIVLHEWYEFLMSRGARPLVNPIPHSADREPRPFAHQSPMRPFDRRRSRRVDPADPKVVPRHMTDEQFASFWALLTCDRDRAMVKLAVDCGVRPGELLALRGEDIGWGDATIHVVRKGARKEQWLPVSRDGITWLRRCQATTGYVAGFDEQVWITTRGPRRPLNYGAYRAVFNRVNGQLGTNWTPHDLRHTACVRMLDGGMDIVKVQQIMGHEYLTTTQTYLRPRLDELIEAHRDALARPAVQPCAVNPYSASDLEAIFGTPL